MISLAHLFIFKLTHPKCQKSKLGWCLSGRLWQNKLWNGLNFKSLALQDQDPTGCCHQHHSGANRTTPLAGKHRVLALYFSPGCDQKRHESNTDCARLKREEQHSSLDRNAVWLMCFYSSNHYFGLYQIFYKCSSACLIRMSYWYHYITK